MVGAAAIGAPKRKIAREFEIPRSTVQDTLNLHPLRNDDRSLSRPGAPIQISQHLKRRIPLVVRKFPKKTYAQIAQEATGPVRSDLFQQSQQSKQGVDGVKNA